MQTYAAADLILHEARPQTRKLFRDFLASYMMYILLTIIDGNRDKRSSAFVMSCCHCMVFCGDRSLQLTFTNPQVSCYRKHPFRWVDTMMPTCCHGIMQ